MRLLSLPHGLHLQPYCRSLFAAATGVLLGSVLGFSLMLWSSRSVPIIINQAYELNRVVYVGGHVDIVYDVDRFQDCPSETSRWIWTWVEKGDVRLKQYFPLPGSSIAAAGLGKSQRFIVSLPLPSGVWPGEWFYSARTVEHCTILSAVFPPKFIESPQVTIHISEKP